MNNREFVGRMFDFIGGVSGLLSIVLIIWKGGVLWQMVSDHDRRIGDMERGGSVGLREHVKLDDERVREIQAQQAFDREIRQRLLADMSEMRSEVRVVSAKLDSIKEQIVKPKP